MKKLLLKMLVCPSCLPEEIELRAGIIHEQIGDIVEGTLNCSRCGGVYPVENGIAFLDPAVHPPVSTRPIGVFPKEADAARNEKLYFSFGAHGYHGSRILLFEFLG